MYRITGEAHWREAGWNMFQAVARTTRAKWGHSAIGDVTRNKPDHLDEMESFWLAETMKYFYLLFETEDVISLDDWVFNTEAHPFKRPKKAVGE
jgi:mannosyl-oligosaccharide alpha-1,2-mannosidase